MEVDRKNTIYMETNRTYLKAIFQLYIIQLICNN